MLSQVIHEKIELYDQAQKKLQELYEASGAPAGVGHRRGAGLGGRYSKKKMMNKAQKDAVFLESLYNETIGAKTQNPQVKQAYDQLVTEAMVYATKILQEADLEPKTVSPAIEYANVISESDMVAHYKRAFNIILEQEFNKPNLRSEIIEEFGFGPGADAGNGCETKRVVGPGVKGLIVKCVKSGILDQNDPEAAIKYLAAEKAVKNGLMNTILPLKALKFAEERANELPDEYTELFGNTLTENIQNFKNTVAKLAAIVAPFIFMKALEESGLINQVKFNPVKLAGMSAQLDADGDFDGDEDSANEVA